MLHPVSQQLSTFLITSAVVSTLVPLHPQAEAGIHHPQVQALKRSEHLQSQNKQISGTQLLKESVKLIEVGIPQRRVSVGNR